MFPATAPAAIGRGLVASSFQYYLSGAENLRVDVYSFLSGFDVDITYRFWREDDRSIQIAHQRVRVAAGLTLNGSNFKLDAGALLGLRVSTTATNIKYGWLFVRAQIIRGLEAATEVLGTLVQGYVSAQNDRAWPGSPIEQYKDAPGVITDGGWASAAQTMIMTVPSLQRYRVMGARADLNTSAVVGNRTVFVRVIGSNAKAIWTAGANNVQPASTLGIYSIGNGSPMASSPTTPSEVLPFPADMDLAAGDSLQFVVGGVQAGDFWIGQGCDVLQWLDP